jgi:hypothetical protein
VYYDRRIHTHVFAKFLNLKLRSKASPSDVNVHLPPCDASRGSSLAGVWEDMNREENLILELEREMFLWGKRIEGTLKRDIAFFFF